MEFEERELERLVKEKKKAQRKNNLKEVAQLCNVIGELKAKFGRFEDAIEDHQMELHLSEALSDSMGTAIANRKIGECYCELGKFDLALKHQHRHLELAQSEHSDIEQQRAWATIGRTYLYQAEAIKTPGGAEAVLRRGEEAFMKSLEVCERLKRSIKNEEYMEMKARLFLNLGLVYDNKRDEKQCTEYMKRAIMIAEKHNLAEDLYRCQFCLSGIYQRNGKPSQALRFLEEALKCARKMNNKVLESEVLVSKAQVFALLGDFPAAKRCVRKAYKIGSPIEEEKRKMKKHLISVVTLCKSQENLEALSDGDEEEKLKLYEKMGDAAANIENYKLALKFYQKMLQTSEALGKPAKDMIPIYISMAQTYADDKQYKNAIAFYFKELECRKGEHEQECRTWLNIAEAQELLNEEYDIISQSYLAAFNSAKKAKHKKLQVHTLRSLSIVQQNFGQTTDRQQTLSKLQSLRQKYNLGSEDEEESEEEEGESQETGKDEEEDINWDDLTDSDDSEDEESSSTATRKVGRTRRIAKPKVNEKGETPLHRACIEGNLNRVKKLLEEGHPVNPRDYCGWLPLHEACNHDYVEIVECLLDHGARIDDRGGEHCGGITPIHDAANCGNVAVVRLLIERGANIQAKDDDGNTPLASLSEYRRRAGAELDAQTIAEIKNLEKDLKNRAGGQVTRSRPPSDINRRQQQTTRAPGSDSEDDLPDLPLRKKSTRRTTGDRSRREREDDLRSCSQRSGQSDGSDVNLLDLSPDRTSDLEHMEESEEVFPFSGVQTVAPIESAEAARTAYQNAISAVGSSAVRNQMQATQREPSHNCHGTTPALLAENEFVDDDWLIDDMRPSKKMKIDTNSFCTGTRMRTNEKRKYDGSHERNERNKRLHKDKGEINTQILVDIDSFGEDSENSSNCDTLPLRNFQGSDMENDMGLGGLADLDEFDPGGRTSTQRPMRTQSKSKRTRQLKLTSYGLGQGDTRHSNQGTSRQSGSSNNHGNQRTSSHHSNERVSELNSSLVRAQEVFLNNSGIQLTPTPASLPTQPVMRVKVKVEEKVLLIPVTERDSSKTMSWLAKEVSQRYYSLCGLRPIVQLGTSDGALFSPEDPISLVLSNGEMIEAIRVTWDMPPLTERYTQACLALGATPYRNVKTILQQCQDSNVLQLKNLALRGAQLHPVFRAIQCHTPLKELQLTGNKLNDSSVQQMMEVAMTLPSLTLLDLAANQITSNGVKVMAETLERTGADNQDKPLQQLQTLNLSYNSLTDVCMLSLCGIVGNLPQLMVLSLASCDLTMKMFQQHRLAFAGALQASSLQRLDISQNRLESTGVELLLMCLPWEKVVSLSLNGTVHSHIANHLTKHVEKYLGQPHCILQELTLDNCHISEEAMEELDRAILHSRTLTTLSLDCNPHITNQDITRLLASAANNSNGCLQRLSASGCGLHSPLDVDFLDAISDKLNHASPLTELTFSCTGVNKVDVESLRQVWQGIWGERGRCWVQGDLVKLHVGEERIVQN